MKLESFGNVVYTRSRRNEAVQKGLLINRKSGIQNQRYIIVVAVGGSNFVMVTIVIVVSRKGQPFAAYRVDFFLNPC